MKNLLTRQSKNLGPSFKVFNKLNKFSKGLDKRNRCKFKSNAKITQLLYLEFI